MNTQNSPSILIVDDDPMVRRLLARHFQKKYEVVSEAADAEQALVVFGERSAWYDVVVTDVHLPGMTGVDMATRIREIRHDQPIVFVTGDVDAQLAKRALEGGSAGYLLKPFEFFELDAAIALALSAQPPAAQRVPSFTPGQASTEWYEDQRRQLLAAAARPVTLSEYPTWHRSRLGFYLRIAAVVLVLVGIAWVVGYGLFPEEKNTGPIVPQTTQQRDNKTVYVPYTAPTAPDRSSDRDAAKPR